ncbi:hypothetical protein SGLAD_v1c02040 [Spiroplasma gladiatoris]|uniref:Uncharacterized protein n=1 Tax=Spiroplasma gladiatoris TaxID=2143 RepID=A0A4P7AI85_9MOLU|nr:hypothetical protein [Spiroplasma gladiatoris]QBQ07403.1 hypothetical protein SGLAD_v1c02040 [Spiroplasma gladiatoris]
MIFEINITNDDVEFSNFKESSKTTEGSIKGSATTNNKIIKNSATFKIAIIKDDISLIKNKELGEIIGNEDLKTSVGNEETLEAINLKNPDLNLTSDDVDFLTFNNSKANLKASSQSNRFRGTLEVKYSYTTKFNISIFEDALNKRGVSCNFCAKI